MQLSTGIKLEFIQISDKKIMRNQLKAAISENDREEYLRLFVYLKIMGSDTFFAAVTSVVLKENLFSSLLFFLRNLNFKTSYSFSGSRNKQKRMLTSGQEASF